MDYEELTKQNKILLEENNILKEEIERLKSHLKRYTAPTNKKQYYEEHKEEIKEKVKEYKQTHQPTAEQKKKWARTAYLKKKEKLEKDKVEQL